MRVEVDSLFESVEEAALKFLIAVVEKYETVRMMISWTGMRFRVVSCAVSLCDKYVMWFHMIRCYVMWCDVMWCDVTWCDFMWCDVMWFHVMWCEVLWPQGRPPQQDAVLAYMRTVDRDFLRLRLEHYFTAIENSCPVSVVCLYWKHQVFDFSDQSKNSKGRVKRRSTYCVNDSPIDCPIKWPFNKSLEYNMATFNLNVFVL